MQDFYFSIFEKCHVTGTIPARELIHKFIVRNKCTRFCLNQHYMRGNTFGKYNYIVRRKAQPLFDSFGIHSGVVSGATGGVRARRSVTPCQTLQSQITRGRLTESQFQSHIFGGQSIWKTKVLVFRWHPRHATSLASEIVRVSIDEAFKVLWRRSLVK